MKTERSANILTIGLFVGLLGSLSLNIYQLGERNRPTISVLPVSSADNIDQAAVLDDLATYQRQIAHQDSVIFSLQHTAPVQAAVHH